MVTGSTGSSRVGGEHGGQVLRPPRQPLPRCSPACSPPGRRDRRKARRCPTRSTSTRPRWARTCCRAAGRCGGCRPPAGGDSTCSPPTTCCGRRSAAAGRLDRRGPRVRDRAVRRCASPRRSPPRPGGPHTVGGTVEGEPVVRHPRRVHLEDHVVAATCSDTMSGRAVSRQVYVVTPSSFEARGEDRLDVSKRRPVVQPVGRSHGHEAEVHVHGVPLTSPDQVGVAVPLEPLLVVASDDSVKVLPCHRATMSPSVRSGAGPRPPSRARRARCRSTPGGAAGPLQASWTA
jgi:hypothetical protein